MPAWPGATSWPAGTSSPGGTSLPIATSWPGGAGIGPGSALFTILDNAWGGTEVNTIVSRGAGVITDLVNNIQYTGWYRYNDGKVYVAKRALGTSLWTSRAAGVLGADKHDLHNYLSMAVDGSGRLHIAYNMHGDPMRYWHGTGPGDIAFDVLVTPPIAAGSIYESSDTYPYFLLWPGGGPYAAGDLLLFFRSGFSGDGNLLLYHWTDATATWSVVGIVFDGDADNVSFYPNSFVLDPTGTIHVCGMVRETPLARTNRGFYYFKSDDGGVSWKKSDGTAYVLPIRDAALERVLTCDTDTGLINSCGMCVDALNHPIVVYYQDFEARYFTQPQVLWFNGSTWQHSQIGRNIRRPFKLSGSAGQGDTRGTLTRPTVVHNNGYTYVIFVSRCLGDGFFCSVSTNLTQWQTFAISSAALANAETVFDPAIWSRDKVLHIIHQYCLNSDVDPGAQTISIMEWTPPTGAITPDTDYYTYDASGAAGCLFSGYAEPEYIEVNTPLSDDNATMVRLINRTGGADFINASASDRPTWERVTWDITQGDGSHVIRPSMRFTKSLTVWMTCDSIAAAFAGLNIPLTLIMALVFDTQTNGDTIFSLGRSSSTNGYTRIGTGGTGNLFITRNTDGGTSATATSSSSLYSTSQYIILTMQFDGTNISGRINGTPMTWATSTVVSNGAGQTVNQATLGALRRSSLGNHFDGRMWSVFLSNQVLTLGAVQAIEAAWGAACGITVVP
jgi:hypothetical protein